MFMGASEISEGIYCIFFQADGVMQRDFFGDCVCMPCYAKNSEIYDISAVCSSLKTSV